MVVQLNDVGPEGLVPDADETAADVFEAFAVVRPKAVIPEAIVVFQEASSANCAGVAVSEATPGMDKAIFPVVVLLGIVVPETDEEKEEGERKSNPQPVSPKLWCLKPASPKRPSSQRSPGDSCLFCPRMSSPE